MCLMISQKTQSDSKHYASIFREKSLYRIRLNAYETLKKLIFENNTCITTCVLNKQQKI